MPTDAEFAALTNNCIATWTTTNGNPNSHGYFWSSTPDSDDSHKAWYLDFNSSIFQRDTFYGRQYWLSVRPVRDAG